MGEEVLVPALEDVELRVVQDGVLVDGAVSLADEAAHSGAALRRELAVEDDDDALVRAGRDDGRFEEEVLHLVLLVQVQSALRRQRPADLGPSLLQTITFPLCRVNALERDSRSP